MHDLQRVHFVLSIIGTSFFFQVTAPAGHTLAQRPQRRQVGSSISKEIKSVQTNAGQRLS
jgi:hypothetical protein